MFEHLDIIDRFAKRGLWMCLVWPALAAPAPLFGPPAMPPELRGVANVEIEEFDVTGETLGEIHQAVEDNLIFIPGMDEPALAMTRSSLGWDWDSSAAGDGACRIGEPEAETRFRILLPRLASTGQPPAVSAQWKLYRRALEIHEAGHVRITLDYARRIRSEVAGRTCREAAVVAARLNREMKLAHDALDDGVCIAWNNGDTSKAARDSCAEIYLEPDGARGIIEPKLESIVE